MRPILRCALLVAAAAAPPLHATPKRVFVTSTHGSGKLSTWGADAGGKSGVAVAVQRDRRSQNDAIDLVVRMGVRVAHDLETAEGTDCRAERHVARPVLVVYIRESPTSVAPPYITVAT